MQGKILARLKHMFDGKRAGIVCVLLAIINKSLIALAFSSLKGDKALYLLFAETLLKTGKLAEPVSMIENGSTVSFFNPAVHAPLYSLLAAPFLWLTNSFFVTQFLLSVIAWTMLYVALCNLATAIFRQRWLVHFFILCSGFFLYPHELSSTPKDTLSVGLTLWSIVLIIKFYKGPNLAVTGFLALALSGLALIKLMYLPLMAALFFLFAVFVLLEKKKRLLIYSGLLIGLLVMAGLAVHYFLFQPLYQLTANQAARLPIDQTPMIRGLYPENLLHTYPFISSSLLNLELWGVQLERLTALSFSELINWFRRLDLVLFILLLVTFLAYSRQVIANRTWFFLIGASLVMIAVTLGSSLVEKGVMYKSSANVWTYVSDARSFLLPIFTIQLALFVFIFFYHRFAFLRIALLSVFLFECFHGIYFTAKHSLQTKIGTEANIANDAMTQVTKLALKANANQPALVTSDNFLRRYAQVKGIKAYAFTSLDADLRWMKKGDVFLIATHLADSAYLQKFPVARLEPMDTVKPLILHRYVAE